MANDAPMVMVMMVVMTVIIIIGSLMMNLAFGMRCLFDLQVTGRIEDVLRSLEHAIVVAQLQRGKQRPQIDHIAWIKARRCMSGRNRIELDRVVVSDRADRCYICVPDWRH